MKGCKRKNLFDYMVLSIFILCLGLAMSAALEFTTLARERPYLLQGKILILTAAIALGLLVLLRLAHFAERRLGERKADVAKAVCFGLILYAAFLLRHFVIATIQLKPESDFETYYRLGSLLVQDKMLSTEATLYREYVAKFPHTIGFPAMVLAPVFSMFGVSVKAGLYANLILSLGSVTLVYAIALKLHGRVCGLLAMLLAAIWPSHVLYSSMLASEPAFTFLILICLLLIVYIFERGNESIRERRPILGVALIVALGAILGIANGIRPMSLILTVAVCMVLLFNGERYPISKGGARQILSRGWLCALIVFLLYSLTSTIITQTVYTIIQLEPASGITASGYNLLVGSNVEHKGVWNQEDADFFTAAFDETGSASAAHRACMEAALERISSNPEDSLDLFVYKFRDLWQSDDFGIDWNLLWAEQQGTLTPRLLRVLESVRPVGRQMYLCVLVFVAIGALQQWRSNEPVEPAFYVATLFFIGTALLHMLLETQVRYHYNMLPFLILLGTYAVSSWKKAAIGIKAGVGEAIGGRTEANGTGAKERDGIEKPQRFDITDAIRTGHIKVTISKASASAFSSGEGDSGTNRPKENESGE